MQTHSLGIRWIAMILMTATIGCDKDEHKQLAEMAERHSQRQAEQSKRMVELQRHVAEGSRQLVEADAKARGEMAVLQREMQAERTKIGQQRDALEEDRRQIATQRHRDPIVATAITGCGLLVVCVLPLVLCWFLLHGPTEPADDSVVAEVLLEDLVADQPLLSVQGEGHSATASSDDKEKRALPNRC